VLDPILRYLITLILLLDYVQIEQANALQLAMLQPFVQCQRVHLAILTAGTLGHLPAHLPPRSQKTRTFYRFRHRYLSLSQAGIMVGALAQQHLLAEDCKHRLYAVFTCV
jgi:hypothetical protein